MTKDDNEDVTDNNMTWREFAVQELTWRDFADINKHLGDNDNNTCMQAHTHTGIPVPFGDLENY